MGGFLDKKFCNVKLFFQCGETTCLSCSISKIKFLSRTVSDFETVLASCFFALAMLLMTIYDGV